MKYKILIIEDEEPAAKRLLKMLHEIDASFELQAIVESVIAATNWLRTHESPDLILSDVQLSDGTSFDAFKMQSPGCPVIFTTAYDQYAIAAFKANGIDYLLKPLKKEELAAAIAKFKKMKGPANDIQQLIAAYGSKTVPYKNRFVVRYGEHFKTIQCNEIAYFYTEDKINFLTTFESRRYVIDANLDQLESLLDPKQYFRINRQYIISIESINEMLAYTKGRVIITLKPPAKEETIVSAERSPLFKAWLDDAC